MKKDANIPVVGKGKSKEPLSKIQKQFNQKIKKINKLKEEIEFIKDLIPSMKLKINEELTPIRREIALLRAEAVVLFDKAYDAKGMGKTQKSKIKDFITEQSFELIEKYGLVELKPIFDKHSEESYEQIEEQSIANAKNSFQSMMNNMGMKVDISDWDISNHEEMARRMAEMQEELKENFEKAKEKQSNKHKSAKELAQEVVEETQKKSTLKTMKEIYNDLVKTFHPDKEQDIEKKAQKTEIMKEVTSVYENQDLFGLLKLQLELKKNELGDMSTLPDEKLKPFVNMLNEQIAELTERKEMVEQAAISQDSFDDFAYILGSPKEFEIYFIEKRQSLLSSKEAISSDLVTFQDIRGIKEFLKGYNTNPPPFDINEILDLMMRGKM